MPKALNMTILQAADLPLAVSKLALFTDFDGTLVDLAPTPDAVEVPNALPVELARAARSLGSALAIVTGREIADIDRFLHPLSLPVAGAHGSQRRRADGIVEMPSDSLLAAAGELVARLAPLAKAHPGLILEPKDGAVALHFRLVPALEQACHEAMEKAVDSDPRFEIVPGKMVVEARPRGPSKGTAIRAFMQERPFEGRVPVFIGDDVTDEDGFIAAQELGGAGVKLGDGDTAAQLRIPDIATVHALLRSLAEAPRESAAAAS